MICPFCGHKNLPGSETCSRCQNDLAPLDLPIAQDRVEQSLMHDTVRCLDPRRPVTLSNTATLGEAVLLMAGRDIGAVLVVDQADHLVGILTERDFLRKVAGLVEDFDAQSVGDFMTPDPVTVTPTATIAFALHKMDTGRYRHLPVVEDGVPIGTISVRDIIRHIIRLVRNVG